MNTFTWLLKREYWEHRGGFKWAPLIAAGVILAVFTIAILTGVNAAQSNLHSAVINNVKLSDIAAAMTPEQRLQIGAGIDAALFFSAAPIAITLAIVSFFYLLGSLYDDRRDRSLLFWKSLPISDLQTVLSKVVSATVTAPLFALAAALVMMLGVLIVLSILVAMFGANPFTVIWTTASPLTVAGKVALLIPINAVWALPSIGWLMLCSAFAKRVPFLWATLLPVAAGTCVSIFDAVTNLRMPDDWFWQHIVFRLLFSIVPGGWLDLESVNSRMEHANGPQDVVSAFDLSNMMGALSGPNIWIGAVAGLGMLAVALWLRRWRDDA
jgi:ABC-2 type transport system permease protein